MTRNNFIKSVKSKRQRSLLSDLISIPGDNQNPSNNTPLHSNSSKILPTEKMLYQGPNSQSRNAYGAYHTND